MFQPSIAPADRMDELKLEVTAPTMAANPSSPISGGTTSSRSLGKVSFALKPSWPPKIETAAIPSSSGGMSRRIVRMPARIECDAARPGVRQESTRWK